MGRKGERVYVPPVIIEELENIMTEHELTIKAEGFRKMAKYSQIGRKVQANRPVMDLNKIELPIGTHTKKSKDMKYVLGI